MVILKLLLKMYTKSGNFDMYPFIINMLISKLCYTTQKPINSLIVVQINIIPGISYIMFIYVLDVYIYFTIFFTVMNILLDT